MSDILFSESFHSQATTQNMFQTLQKLMKSLAQAQILSPFQYTSSIFLHRGKLDLLWKFGVMKNGSLRLNIRPNFSDSVGGNFRVDTQRGYVDLLQTISSCNRQKKFSFSFMVSQYNFIEISTTFEAENLKKTHGLRRYLKITLQQLPETIKYLIKAIQPFLGSSHHQPSYSQEKDDKPFRNCLDKLVLLSQFNLLHSPNPVHRMGAQGDPELKAEAKMEEERVDAVQKVGECLKVLGEQTNCLQSGSVLSHYRNYSQWINRNKQDPRSIAPEKQRNVFCVKIKTKPTKQIVDDLRSSHCKIIRGTYGLKVLLSVNPEVDLEAKLKAKQRNLPSKETFKQMELARKELKIPFKPSSVSSLQNELDFIFYIKEKMCTYVSTYYLISGVDRDKLGFVLMNFYPLSMRQMLFRQGHLLPIKQKIVLLRRIIAGVSWLASNYVCHRDIKPQNIMISSEQRIPKLIDFGSCCAVRGARNAHLQVTESRLLGTPNYYLPFPDTLKDTYQKAEYQQHILFDVFSLGKIIEEVFPQGVLNLMPHLNNLMEYIIQRCQEMDPAKRLTYQQLLYLFEKIEEHLEQLEKR